MREAKMLVTFLLLLFIAREGETQTTQEICTEVAVDVGFVLDSSGSVGSYYQNEKDFIKDIATAFFGRSNKNRAGVVTFSSNAELSIGLGQYHRGTDSAHVQAFRNAVDAIRFHNSGTRIDLGLNVAKTLFKYNEAGRDNVQKLLVLLTDGRTGGSPIPIADEMRRSGVMIVVIGIGNNIDVNMLKRIGGTGNYYGASSFTQLVTNEFVNSITKASCETIYLPAKDGKYYKLYNETKTFDSSKTFCKNEGAHLLIGDSLETMEIVRNHYASLSIWLGAQYDSHRGAWFWLDGQPVGSNAEWGSQGPRGNNVCLSAREGRLYHAPCTADHVFVCQKGVSKPDPPVVSYSLQNQWDPTYNLLCEFHRKILTVPSTYEVSWYSSQPSGEMLISTNIISSNQNYSYYSGAYFGYKVYAKVRMWYTNEASTKSEYAVSNTIYLGFETQPSKVTLIEGGPSVELKIRPNSPILCKAYRQDCKMTLFVNTLSGNKDVKVSPCYVTFKANETLEWKTITLKAKGDLVDNGVTTRTLNFSFYPDSFVASMWRNHYPMSIEVRRESVSTGRCTSTGDPHIRTFDGLYYDHYHVGDYVLVKSLARDFEIHVRTQKCASVSCNCGVTVKEGNDVLSINMCGAYAAPDIQYLSNREPEHGTWIEQSPNGKTFIIKLASTAFVKFAARPWSNTFYADITVQLPAPDYNRTTGLCGNMDRIQWNDQMDKGGIIRSGCGRQACTAFTESWKLSKAESLFCYNGGEAKCLEMQDRQKNKQGSEESDDQCVHGSFTTTSSPWSVLPIVSNAKKTDQVTKGFKKMVFPGQRDCDAKRNSSTPNDVVVLPEGDTAVSCDDLDVTPTSSPVVPKFPTPSGITESRARTWCRSKIEGSTVYTVCRQKMGNALPVEGFISQCVEDVKILDDLVVGLQSAVEALTSLCEDIVQKNETNPQPILEQICINECSFRGRCDNGSCICDDGFTSEDCSVDTNQVPEIVSSVILCDVRKTPCNKIRVRSMKIVPGAISCGYWSNNGRSFTTKPVELINFAEVAVELHKPDDRKDRYLANTIPMETYVLVLTNNNGQNYSSPGVPVVVYDSKCMVCSNATVRGGVVESRCELKSDSCFIDGYCYGSGDVDPSNPNCRVCDPTRSTEMFLIGEDKPITCRDHKRFDLQCTRESLTATWETGVFITKTPLVISLNDPECNVFYQNQTHTWITTNFTACGTVIHQYGDLIIQENVARVVVHHQHHIITRKTSYLYNFSCVFDRKLNVMTANTFLASDRLFKENGTATSTFSAYIEMFQSSSYLQIHTEDSVPVITFEPMYFGIKTDNKNAGLKFVVDQCYASPTAGGEDIKYVFYDKKCALDSTFKINDYSNKHFNFEIEAFNFIRVRNSVRIHCKLQVCKANSTLQECQQECALSRKRKDLDEALSRRPKRSVDEELASIETIDIETTCDIIYRKKKTCKDIVCPSNSTCLELYPAVCRCNTGFIRETASNKCRRGQDLNVRDIHLEMPYLETYNDPASHDYLRLVTRIKNELLTTLDLDNTIEGLKVIDVHNGSVIADVALLFSKTVSREEAFASFLTTTMAYARNNTGALQIKPDMVPRMDLGVMEDPEVQRIEKELVEEISTLIIGVVVAIIVLILGVTLTAILCYRKRRLLTPVKKFTFKEEGIQNQGSDLGEVQG